MPLRSHIQNDVYTRAHVVTYTCLPGMRTHLIDSKYKAGWSKERGGLGSTTGRRILQITPGKNYDLITYDLLVGIKYFPQK